MLQSVYWYLPTFRDNVSVPFSRVKQSNERKSLVYTAREALEIIAQDKNVNSANLH